jgi:hypothetical protein
MKYKLPRQVISPELRKIIAREMRRQKMRVLRASKADLKEIAEILKAIEGSGLPKYLVCKKLPKDLGSGIFLHPDAEPILKGQVIAPYAGAVSLVPQNRPDEGTYAFTPVEDMHLTRKEQALFDPGASYHPGRLYAFKVDALKKGNFARFINHSEKPNVIAHLFSIPANPYGLTPASIEVVYVARKMIRPGEQLLVSYEEGEKSYWGALKVKPVPMTPQTYQLSPALKVIQERRRTRA